MLKGVAVKATTTALIIPRTVVAYYNAHNTQVRNFVKNKRVHTCILCVHVQSLWDVMGEQSSPYSISSSEPSNNFSQSVSVSPPHVKQTLSNKYICAQYGTSK